MSSDVFGGSMGFGAHNAGDPVHQRFARTASRNLMASDPPVHPRLRGLLSHAFTASAIRTWGTAVQTVTDEVLAAVTPGRKVDAVADLGDVLPVVVISDLLGVPIADRSRFRRLSVGLHRDV
jgi:cytochrome P450